MSQNLPQFLRFCRVRSYHGANLPAVFDNDFSCATLRFPGTPEIPARQADGNQPAVLRVPATPAFHTYQSPGEISPLVISILNSELAYDEFRLRTLLDRVVRLVRAWT